MSMDEYMVTLSLLNKNGFYKKLYKHISLILNKALYANRPLYTDRYRVV